MNNTAIVQRAEQSEEQLICEAQQAISSSAWTVGKIAHEWTERFSRGRTDADFGQLVGLTRDQVAKRRLVWIKFGKCDLNHRFPRLRFTHFEIALGWDHDEAITCLSWAHANDATVNEMRVWRRAQRGEDLFTDLEPEETVDSICESAGIKPEEPVARPRKPETAKKADSGPGPQRGPASVSQTKPPEDPQTRIMFALREISQVIDAIEDRKRVATKFRKLADQLDPPKKFRPPTVDEVADYCRRRKNSIEPESFVAFYAANGWKLSNGNKMADWQAAVITWEKRDQGGPRGSSSKATQRAADNDAAFREVFGE